jgi:hypothetical protein
MKGRIGPMLNLKGKTNAVSSFVLLGFLDMTVTDLVQL